MKNDEQDKSPELDPDAWAKAALKAAIFAWVKGGKGGRLFSKADREAWAKATPGEQLRLTLEFTESVARDTAAAKVTGIKGLITLYKAADRLRTEYLAITNVLALLKAPELRDAASLARCHDTLARAIHVWGLLHFQIGQHAGMVDKRAEKPVRAWTGGKASGRVRNKEADETWRPHALKLALAARKDNPSSTQKNVAAAITKGWRLKIPCPKTQLLLAIRRWERDGKLPKRSSQ
jgi:hypothetical protein